MKINISVLLNPSYSLVFVIIIAFLPNYCSCIKHETQNNSRVENRFSQAVATWYGDPNGAGSVGGACGYRFSVEKPPFSAMISAGNANLFQSGLGCGTCYEVKCTENSACSGIPVTVTITDECPCDSGNVHFDLSGVAFGAMAKPGKADVLRQAGTFNVEYRRVPCNYPNTTLAFDVDPGSNPNYFACVIKYLNGDGDLSSVELQTVNLNRDVWLPMQHSWGAIWKIDLASGVKAPFSIRLTTLQTKEVIVAENVIPADWEAGKSYES
ncbi:hypothetical protein CDL12_06334 [Handroanthus impetiginosus]|uniref:Expansin-like EG45 domain-containing protein n=1 Tax=Handroanthus impetiginosus TaxID=429701 RepID=A0A2G9HTX6_9LAMI|nr:hypothetical protein CDL12_06334 [Handroanthus impetiginosus]